MPKRPQFVSDVRHMLRALRSYNYRLFFAGQGISLIGTWMQQIAMSWLVYKLTGSALLLGVVGFISQIPNLVVMPLVGVWIDHADRRRILILTQSLAMFQAVVLSVIVFAGVVKVWHIYVLGLFLGIVNAVDMPTRQAFVIKMVSRKEDLGSAIALNSALFNGARLIGPTIAGLVIAAFGEKVCFLINAISYLAVICSLIAMRIGHKKPGEGNGGLLERLREGASYTFGFAPIWSLLAFVSFLSLLAMPYITVMPVVAREVLGGGAPTFGFLMGAVGVGALAGALFLASRKDYAGLWKILPITAFMFGTGLILASFSKPLSFALVLNPMARAGIKISHAATLLLPLLFMILTGFGMMVSLASSNTLIQNIVDDSKRGRVMSFYTSSMMGVLPFGNLLMGKVVDSIGAPQTLLIGGGLAILAAAVFATQISRLKAMSLAHAAPTAMHAEK